MKILLDNIVFELQTAGGISAIWEKHIRYLKKHGYTFECIENPAAQKNIFRKSLAIDNLVMPDRKFPLILRRYLSVPTRGFDLFHSSYYRTPSRKIRNVVTIHDFMYEKFDSFYRKLIHNQQKKKALRESDAVICVSEHTKKDLFKFYPWAENKPVFVVYNGVDEDFFELSDIPESINLDGCLIPRKSFFLYVGSRGYCKNFPAALDAIDSCFARDHHLELVVVGGGAFTTDELSLIGKRNLESRITKLDNVSFSTLNLLYNTARALIFPSFYEGFGIPALEASRAKCPVISSNTSSIPEVIGDNPFAFDPSNTNEMIKKLELLDDDIHVQEAVNGAYLHSLNFSWDKTSKETINVYSHVLGKP